MDVDGTLTDGTITYTTNGTELKSFHARDGAGIKLLPRAGIAAAIVSGRTSKATVKRAAELGIDEVHQGVDDKAGVLESIRTRLGLTPGQVAFMGDDLTDIPAMRASGFSAAPGDADPEVKRIATYVCKANGGRGAVREAIEHLLRGMGVWAQVLRELGAGDATTGAPR
jgi:3-deoxy-D-manno-octulosonate 8-phosphate phosphatase (KDO 8-P phosphatase)